MVSDSTAIAASLGVLSAAALLLAVMVFLRFYRERQACHLYWSVGLFLVFVTLAEEVPLYVGVWSEPLIQSYLILVAILVGILSLGSAELALSGRWRTVWFGYMGVMSAGLVVFGLTTSVSPGIVVNGVVSGLPPPMIEILSTLITVPGALLLIVASLYGAIRAAPVQPPLHRIRDGGDLGGRCPVPRFDPRHPLLRGVRWGRAPLLGVRQDPTALRTEAPTGAAA